MIQVMCEVFKLNNENNVALATLFSGKKIKIKKMIVLTGSRFLLLMTALAGLLTGYSSILLYFSKPETRS